jgi:hypothetical protein
MCFSVRLTTKFFMKKLTSIPFWWYLSHPKTSSKGVGSYVMDDLKSPAHWFEAQEIYSQTPEAITVAFKLMYIWLSKLDQHVASFQLIKLIVWCFLLTNSYLEVWLKLLFKVFLTYKCIKIIFFIFFKNHFWY